MKKSDDRGNLTKILKSVSKNLVDFSLTLTHRILCPATAASPPPRYVSRTYLQVACGPKFIMPADKKPGQNNTHQARAAVYSGGKSSKLKTQNSKNETSCLGLLQSKELRDHSERRFQFLNIPKTWAFQRGIGICPFLFFIYSPCALDQGRLNSFQRFGSAMGELIELEAKKNINRDPQCVPP